MNAYLDAIDSAQNVFDDPDATQEEIDAALADLQDATSAFNASKAAGTFDGGSDVTVENVTAEYRTSMVNWYRFDVIGDYNTVQIKTDDGTDLGPAMTEAAFEDAGYYQGGVAPNDIIVIYVDGVIAWSGEPGVYSGPVAVTGVTLDKETLTLTVGGADGTLAATITPVNASNKNVSWTSSDESVATVDNGIVTPVAAGTATITVTTEDGSFTDTCEVTVETAPTQVTVENVTAESRTSLVNWYRFDVIGDYNTVQIKTDDGTDLGPAMTEAAFEDAGYYQGGVAPNDIIVIYVDGVIAWSGEPGVYSGPVAVTGVTLDKETLTLTVGGADGTLAATITPVNASNKNVSWTSSDESVATVDNGIVTPVAAGTATITVTTEDGSFTDTCEVTVETASVVEPSISPASFDLNKNAPVNDISIDITWGSATQVNDVNLNVVTSQGSPIQLSLNDLEAAGNGKFYYVEGNVLTIKKELIGLFDIFGYPLSTIPDGFPINLDIIFDVGQKTFLITIVDGETPTVAVTGVTLDKETLTLTVGGADGTLAATITPVNASNKNVSWTSSDESVATVDNGIVTPVAAGTATITVTTEDGSFTDTCEVTVETASVVEPSISPASFDLNKNAPVNDISIDITWGSATQVNDVNLNVVTSQGSPIQLSLNDLEAAGNGKFYYVEGNVLTIKKELIGLFDIFGYPLSTIPDGFPINLDIIFDVGQKTFLITIVDGETPTVAVTGVTLDKETLTLTVGGADGTLAATITPVNASNKNVSWTSSDESVATVDNGIVTPVAAGTATITVTTEDGSFTDTCEVTVETAPTQVTVENVTAESRTSLVNWYRFDVIGDYNTVQIKTDDGTDLGPAMTEAAFEDAGYYQGGVAPNDIIVIYVDGVIAWSGEPGVYSGPVAVTGVTLDKETLTLTVGGADGTLAATITPVNASNKNVSWTSSDESVATVDNGIVTPVAAGTATITVTTEDGSFTDTCEVTVETAPTQVTVENVTAESRTSLVNWYRFDVIGDYNEVMIKTTDGIDLGPVLSKSAFESVGYYQGGVSPDGIIVIYVDGVEKYRNVPGTYSSPIVTVTDVSIKTPPAKVTYFAGDALDLRGLAVTLYKSNGTTRAFSLADFAAKVSRPLGLMVSAYISNTTVTSTVDGKNATQPITVNAVTVTGVSVKTPPSKVTYFAGDALNLSGLVVTLYKSNGTTEDVSLADFAAKGITTSPANGATLNTNDKKVTITVNGKKATQPITVNAVTVTGVSVKTPPANVTYYDGELLDLTGLVVTLTKSNGMTEDVALKDFASKGITTDPGNGSALTNTTSKVMITANGQTCWQAITVNQVTVDNVRADRSSLIYTYYYFDIYGDYDEVYITDYLGTKYGGTFTKEEFEAQGYIRTVKMSTTTIKIFVDGVLRFEGIPKLI